MIVTTRVGPVGRVVVDHGVGWVTMTVKLGTSVVTPVTASSVTLNSSGELHRPTSALWKLRGDSNVCRLQTDHKHWHNMILLVLLSITIIHGQRRIQRTKYCQKCISKNMKNNKLEFKKDITSMARQYRTAKSAHHNVKNAENNKWIQGKNNKKIAGTGSTKVDCQKTGLWWVIIRKVVK